MTPAPRITILKRPIRPWERPIPPSTGPNAAPWKQSPAKATPSSTRISGTR